MQPRGAPILTVLLALSLVTLLAGCRGGGAGPLPVQPDSAQTEPIPGVTAEVWEVRHDGADVLRTPALSGQDLIVGPGEVTVNLRLPKGTTLDGIKPFMVLEPGEVRFNTAEWEDAFVVDVLWPDHEIPKIGFILKKGAPLGAPGTTATTLTRDFTLTIERRTTTATFTIAEVGNERVAFPYTGPRWGYDLAAGTHTFKIAFSKAMNRASVEGAVTKALSASAFGYPADTPVSPPTPTFNWKDDKTVEVSLEMDAGPGASRLWGIGRHYLISPNGAADKEGVAVSYQGDLWLAVKSPVAVFRVPATSKGGGEDAGGGTAGEPVFTLNPGLPVTDVDREGRRFLALENMGDNPIGDSGDGPAWYVPRLYAPGGGVSELFRTTGEAQDFGFCDDGRMWVATMREVTVAAADDWENSSLKAGTGVDFIFDGLAVSEDGWTAAYLMRAPGQSSREAGTRVDLDLRVVHPKSPAGLDATFRSIAKIPAMSDFYGPPVGMAIDREGKTLIFNDLSVTNHPLAVVDLETGAKRTIAPPTDIPVGVPIAGFKKELAISADGKVAAGVVSDRIVIADLAAGSTRSAPIPKGFQYLGSARPFSSAMKFSPDGALLAFQIVSVAEPNGEAKAMVYDLASGDLIDRGPGRLVGWSSDGGSVYVVRMAE